jgi:dTDP-4-dehydrorhamnose reductase
VEVKPLHLLVTGGAGQVGLALGALDWPDGVVVHRPDRAALDLADPASIRQAFAAVPFAAVINAGAYTAVDRAESDLVQAFAVNALAPAVLAELTGQAGIPLVQISTDYVFDGASAEPYVESDPVAPLGVYGASKLAGELAVRTGNPRSVILRTAWVLSPYRANFVKTMLRLAAERPVLRVVADQTGNPTSADDIAAAVQTIVLRLINDAKAPTGAYHFVNAGRTSWAGLAARVMEQSGRLGGPSVAVEPITTADYPTPARRPTNSALSTARIERDYGVTPRDWSVAVDDVVEALVAGRNA